MAAGTAMRWRMGAKKPCRPPRSRVVIARRKRRASRADATWAAISGTARSKPCPGADEIEVPRSRKKSAAVPIPSGYRSASVATVPSRRRLLRACHGYSARVPHGARGRVEASIAVGTNMVMEVWLIEREAGVSIQGPTGYEFPIFVAKLHRFIIAPNRLPGSAGQQNAIGELIEIELLEGVMGLFQNAGCLSLECQIGEDETFLRGSLKCGMSVREEFGCEPVIAIQGKNEICARFVEAAIARPGKPPVFLMHNPYIIGQAFKIGVGFWVG